MFSDKEFEHTFSPTTFYVWSLLLKTLCYIREHAKSSLACKKVLSGFATCYAL